MTKLLQQALAEIDKLSDIEQNALARWILQEVIAERRWEHLLADSERSLSKLSEEALEEYGKGETKSLDPDAL